MRRLDAQIEYYDRLESPLAPTFEARDKTARRGMPAATGGVPADAPAHTAARSRRCFYTHAACTGAAAASPGSMLALTDVGRKKSGEGFACERASVRRRGGAGLASSAKDPRSQNGLAQSLRQMRMWGRE